MRRKIAFLAFYFSEERYDLIDTPDAFAKRALALAQMGYDGVELMVRDARRVDAALLRRLAAQGVRCAALGTGKVYTADGLSFSDPDAAVRAAAVQRIRDSIDLAASLGCPPVILGSCRGVTAGKNGEGLARVCECLAQCADRAQQQGVRLALEPMPHSETPLINTVDEGLAVLRRVASPALFLTLDTCNMNIEEASLEAAVLRAAGRIAHVQVADNNRRYPSAGHIDFERFLAVLYASGYDGYISAELGSFGGDPLGDARLALGYLRAVTAPLC